MKRYLAKALYAGTLIGLTIGNPGGVVAQDGQDTVDSADRIFAEAHDWIYDNPDAGFELARKTRRPLMVVIRCPP